MDVKGSKFTLRLLRTSSNLHKSMLNTDLDMATVYAYN